MAATRSLGLPMMGLSARASVGMRQVLAYVWRVASTRQGLVGLDERMLKDLGISRAQAEFEVSRPVWRMFG